MATTRSPESYIGSVLKIISNSGIRYQGILFHINPRHSTIALQNVRCFGTEGRRKDGPEVPPSDHVYDYIYFRGTDIKDLEVLSSPTFEHTHSIHDDPAIIQCHSFPPAPPSGSGPGTFPAGPTASTSGFGSDSLPGSAYNSSRHQYNHPSSHVGSWTTSSIPSGIDGDIRSPDRVTNSQHHHQALLQPPPPPAFLLSPGHQQQMQYSFANVPESPHSVAEPVHCGFPGSASTLPTNLSMDEWIVLATEAPPSNPMGNGESTTPNVDLSSSLLSMSGLPCPGPELSSGAYQTVDKHHTAPGSALPRQSEPMPTTSDVGTSSLDNFKASVTSPVTAGRILGPGPFKLCSSNPSRISHKDIEVVQPSTSKSQFTDSTNFPLKSLSAEKATNLALNVLTSGKGPNLPSKQRPVKKFTELFCSFSTFDSQSNRAPSHLPSGDKNGRGVRNRLHGSNFHVQHIAKSNVLKREDRKLDGAPLLPLHNERIQVRGTGNKLGGAALFTHHGKEIQARGKGNRLYAVASGPPFHSKIHAWGTNNRMDDPALRSRDHGWDQGKGRMKMISHEVAKFSEDFDFVAMNEKFKKDEIWGQLSQSGNTVSKDKGKANESGEDILSNEDVNRLPKVGMKAVYVKDEFFDSFSCNMDHGGTKGRVKFSEQMKLDKETFGDFRIKRGNRGGQAWGYRCRGGYGDAGRYQGRAMRSRIT
ncbi:hypothetical protein Tsubulata_033981 [Turnera subulata]|uniref:DFDF domain-containing protein n=1 Tax=Turnera subulata TaxID=218843 RepID=A0A9Q0FHD8_9ROSI|nr:hypothetical protein Tsubulata_033981 [Turnera subulata]